MMRKGNIKDFPLSRKRGTKEGVKIKSLYEEVVGSGEDLKNAFGVIEGTSTSPGESKNKVCFISCFADCVPTCVA
jgi:hypothetical protein